MALTDPIDIAPDPIVTQTWNEAILGEETPVSPGSQPSTGTPVQATPAIVAVASDYRSPNFVPNLSGWELGSNGVIRAIGVILSGDISAITGHIANWTISGSALSTGAFDTLNTMYFGTSGLSLSNTFKVTPAGVLTATGITVTGALTTGAGSSINGTYLTALSVTAAKIAAGTITADKIAAGTITSNEILTNTLTVGTNVLLGTAQTAGQVTTIIGNTVTTGFLNAVGVTTGSLVVGTNVGLGTAQDSAGVTSIIGNTIDTSFINALAITALGTVTAGSISVVSGANTIGFTPAGTYAIFSGTTGSPQFKVTPAGALTAQSGTIGGTTITDTTLYGGIIQTSATVGAGNNGVIMDGNGLRGYDSVLGKVFDIHTDGSAPEFAFGNISNSIFEINTNAILRTSATVGDGSASSAGILINDTGIYATEANQTLANANVKILIDGTAVIKMNVKGGQTDFNTGTGYFLGSSGGVYKLSIGSPAGNYMTWDGQYLKLRGSLDVGVNGLINNSVYTNATLPSPAVVVGFNVASSYE